MSSKRKKSRKKGPRSALGELISEALRHEAMTLEGIVNIVTVALVVVALIAGPFLSGARGSVVARNGEWSAEVTMGDVTGGLGWLVVVIVVCLVFVGGTNYLRDRGRE